MVVVIPLAASLKPIKSLNQGVTLGQLPLKTVNPQTLIHIEDANLKM